MNNFVYDKRNSDRKFLELPEERNNLASSMNLSERRNLTKNKIRLNDIKIVGFVDFD
jgi:hypothetical protein